MTASVPTAVRLPDEAALENPQGCQSVGGTTAEPSRACTPADAPHISHVRNPCWSQCCDRGGWNPNAVTQAQLLLPGTCLTQHNRHKFPGAEGWKMVGGKKSGVVLKNNGIMDGWAVSKQRHPRLGSACAFHPDTAQSQRC